MTGNAWQAKSCTTALAAWAQLRHAWALQAKQTTVVLCAEDRPRPVGFVEPNPAFFACMKKMAERTAELLKLTGTRNDPRFSTLAELRNLLHFLEANAASHEGMDRNDWKNVNEKDTLREIMRVPDKLSSEQAREFYPKAISKVKRDYRGCSAGEAEWIQMPFIWSAMAPGKTLAAIERGFGASAAYSGKGTRFVAVQLRSIHARRPELHTRLWSNDCSAHVPHRRPFRDSAGRCAADRGRVFQSRS